MAREKRFATHGNRCGSGKVHRYVRDSGIWHVTCRRPIEFGLGGPYGEEVDPKTPVTCLKCDPSANREDNMAFREVTGGNAIDIKQTPNLPYEGIYTGHRTFETQYGEQVVWNFRGKSNTYGIYGFTTLNRAMETVSEGTLCRVTFTGKEKMKTKRGIVDVNTCRVEVDDSGTADPNDLPDTYPAKEFDPDDAKPKAEGVPF